MKMSRQGWSTRRSVCSVLTLIAFAWCFVVPRPAHAEMVVLPAQTSVVLTTTTVLDPALLNIGDIIHLQVANDVSVDGKVVIRAGAPAVGRVTHAKKNNYAGVAAQIGIAVEHVEAVDGNQVSITGAQIQEGDSKMVMSIALSVLCCILFLLMKGGEASIPIGTQVIANTTVRTEVAV